MTENLGNAVVGIGMDSRDFLSGMAGIKGQIGGLPGLMLTASAAITAGLVGVGVTATKMAGDFQTNMTRLVTSAGESQKNLAKVSSGILALAPVVGTTTTELSKGMYMIESAGFHGATGLNVLKIAAEGAKAEGASLGEMANAVTSGLNAYGYGADKAAMVTNTFVATVANGKMRMADLVASIANVIPAADKGGVSLQEVGAAMATMTMQGTPAAQATTYLRQMIINLEAPGKKAVDTMKSIGLSASQVAQDMRKSPDGVINTLQEISAALSQKFPQSATIANAEFAKVKAGQESMDQALANLAKNTSPQYIGALRDIAGGAKNMMAMLELTGPQLEVFRNNLANITNQVKSGGQAIAGWTDIQHTFNFKLQQTQAQIEVLMITLGTKLLPIVGDLVTKYVQPAIQSFIDWANHGDNLSNTVQNIFNAISSVVIPLANFIGWLHAGSAPAQIFTMGMIGLGIAITSVRIGGMVSDMASFISKVPEMVAKMFLVQQAAEATAGANGIASIGTSAKGAAAASRAWFADLTATITGTETEVATASTAMGLSLGGIATIAAASIAAGFILVKHAVDTYNENLKNGYGVPAPNDNSRFSTVNRNSAVHDALAQAAKDAKYWDDQIKIADQDMSDLTDKYQQNGVVLGILGGITGDFSDHLTKADMHAIYLKSDLDKVDKHYQPQIITDSIQNAMNKARETKLALDDLQTIKYVHIGTYALDSAISKTMYLKSKLDDLSGTTSVNTSSGYAGPHASGGYIPPGMWGTAGEQGPEVIYGGSTGVSVFPHSSSSSGGGGNVHIYFDSMEFMHVVASRQDQYVRARLGPRSRNN